MSDRSANDDELLSAFIDGALASEQAAALRARLEREPDLAARFDAMQRAEHAVRAAYRDVADEPLPQGIVDLLEASRASGAKVVTLDVRRRGVLPAWPLRPQAIAATVVLALGLAVGFGVGRRSADVDQSGLLAATGMVAPGSPLHTLLESVPSGTPRGLGDAATGEARLTFRAVDGAWCRELILDAPAAANAAVACRRNGQWRVELVAVASKAGQVYRPAGAADTPFAEAVDTLLDGEPLEADAERALLEGGWAND